MRFSNRGNSTLAARGRRCLLFLLVLAIPSVGAAAKPRAPKIAPSFQLPARAGTASLDSLRGHVVLVDFWASWCVPCRRSFPWMNGLQERYGSQGLTIVAINVDKDRAAADRFLAEHPASFTVAYDRKGETAEAFGVAAMPTSFLVARDGAIVHTQAGFDPHKTAAVESLIAGKLRS
jgi:thiol-disulfide isomerase/thioredoxin